MAGAFQDKLSRVRRPRVHITYEVETNGAMEIKELPFVVGVMAALSGHRPEGELGPLKDRKFIQIDRDNFNDVMSSIGPRMAFSVENKLVKDGSYVNAELKFRNMDDFGPVNLINQVPALKKLFDARNRLSDLLAKLDGNDELDGALQKIVNDTDALKKIKSEGVTTNA